MNILAKKLSIIEWLLKLQDETILNKISLLQKYSVDKWDELTSEQQAEIDEAIAQLERGEGIPHEKVMANARRR